MVLSTTTASIPAHADSVTYWSVSQTATNGTYSDTPTLFGDFIGGNTWTAPVTGNLTSITTLLKRYGDPDGIQIDILINSTKTVVGTTFNNATKTITNWTWVTTAFNPPVPVTAGVEYAAVSHIIGWTGNSTTGYRGGDNNMNPYPGGVELYSSNKGGTYYYVPANDEVFIINGTAPAPPMHAINTKPAHGLFSVLSRSGNSYTFTYTGPEAQAVRWNYGDGFGETGEIVAHTYPNASQHTVRVYAYFPDGTVLTDSTVVGRNTQADVAEIPAGNWTIAVTNLTILSAGVSMMVVAILFPRYTFLFRWNTPQLRLKLGILLTGIGIALTVGVI